jgi:uncharacterized RDD family membrane protein YckC
MTNANDVLKIDTPENVTFDYEVAGIGSRFLAALVDTVVIVLLQVIVIGVLILLVVEFEADSDEAAIWIVALLSLVAFAFFWGYYIFFEILWNGQTPGKRWVGLRVIRLDGTPVTAAEVVIRNLVRVIDLLPTAYGVGVISMFLNHNSRRLGDLAAGTIVVHDARSLPLSEMAANRRGTLSTLKPGQPVPPGFPLERLGPQQVRLIEEFLLRRYQLDNGRQLAQHILSSLYQQLDLPADSAALQDAEATLAAIHSALQKHAPD